MCSWCYGFSPTFKKVLEELPSEIKIVYVQGGLAPHSSAPMQNNMKIMLQNTWKQIEQQVGVKFNHNFWTQCQPRRSTYLACQASIAARIQNKEAQMIQAIQESYYLKAENPSNRNTLELAAKNISLDSEKFKIDLESQKTIELFNKDLYLRNTLGVNSFPSLVLKCKDTYSCIKIQYNNEQAILKEINDLIKKS